MPEQQAVNGQKQLVTSKSFMTVGPTLHYSHANVYQSWFLAIVAFLLTCLFWTKVTVGSFLLLGFGPFGQGELWRLGEFVTSPLNILEYPWHILVLGFLMGIMAVIPVLTSQLLSFSYSLPFIFAVAFLANLPGFAAALLISCIAVACRPLRFRSRFVAIALCMVPQLIYWAYFGGAKGVEPIKLGFSFAPWIGAWLVSLTIAAEVLAVGHYTRYKPGPVWIFAALTLAIAYGVFEKKVGFAELAYQRYIAKNSPEAAYEFHDQSITGALDNTINNSHVRRYLEQFFYPAEPTLLRTELKGEIAIQLGYGRWPSWFLAPPELNFQAKRQWLMQQYDTFINSGFRGHKRMPIALYYKALLIEYTPDQPLLTQKEILHFYSDYPHQEALPIWYRLYEEYGQSSESLEARYRIAMRLAGQGKFERAQELIGEAKKLLAEKIKTAGQAEAQMGGLFTVFTRPAASAITVYKLTELSRKLEQLEDLIGPQNRTEQANSHQRLARFVMLNPHRQDYPEQLDALLVEIKQPDPLVDNIMLAQAMLIAEPHRQAEKLAQLWGSFRDTDGGVRAIYELVLLKVRLWKELPQEQTAIKQQYLTDARELLTTFTSLYPHSIFTQQAKTMLNELPMASPTK